MSDDAASARSPEDVLSEREKVARLLGCEPTPEAIRDALIAKIQAARTAGARRDTNGPQLVERVVLKKFDRTPLPGEDIEPIETVIIEDGQYTVLPGKGE